MRETFEKLRAKWLKTSEAARVFGVALRGQYGEHYPYQAPKGKLKRLDALRAREDKASAAIFAWLDANSPRQWRTGVPAYWICESLTYDDAVTSGQLSVVPPPSYGCYPSDSIRFAQPIGCATVLLSDLIHA